MTKHRLAWTLTAIAGLGIVLWWPSLTAWSGADAGPLDPHPFIGASRTLLPDGDWLFIGGQGPTGPVGTMTVWDPQTGTSAPLAVSLQPPRRGHSATLLPDGTVLIVGGEGVDGHVIGDVAVFDPATETFRAPTSGPLTPRAYHTATLLTDGRVVLAGGLSDEGAVLGTVELWNPRSGTVAMLAAELETPRYAQTATLLPNGVVVLWGGYDQHGNALDNGEVFDPETQRVTAVESFLPPFEASPPQLEASIPEDGAGGVATDGLIALRFSKPLRVETVNPDTVTLTGPEGIVTAKVVGAEGGMLAFVTPQAPLRDGATYNLTVSGASDPLGVPLSPTIVAFTTRGPITGRGGPGSPTPAPAAVSPTAPTARPEQPAAPTDEEWTPTGATWRTGRPDSPWRSLPPLQAPAGVTALAGQVLALNGQPLVGIRLAIDNRTAQTDTTGRFLLTDLSPGHAELMIDGGATHGMFEVGVDLVQGKTTALPYTIWLPKIDLAHAVTIPSPTTEEVVITTPKIPGLEVRIPPGTVIRDYQGKIVTRVSITPVPLDRPPFPLPEGVKVPLYFTVQPGCTYVANATGTGARLIYPNEVQEPPGVVFDFWNYDAEERGWYIYGHGRVSADASQVVPDPGVEIYEFTGAMVAGSGLGPGSGPPPCPSGCCAPGSDGPSAGGSGAGSGGGSGSGGGFGDPPTCGGGGYDGYDGEPVHLATGLFVMRHVDLFLPDMIPIVFARTYRQNDGRPRAFGLSATHPYDIFLVGDATNFTFIDLILPDGGRVHFNQTSTNPLTLTHTSSPSRFYGAQITQAATGPLWQLRLRDGTVFRFPDSFAASRPAQAAVVSIQDRFGNTMQFTRDTRDASPDTVGRLRRITSPRGRWIELHYESPYCVDCISSATDNIGRQVRYTYDPSGRLITVQDANTPAGVTTYSYDGTSDRILTVKTALENALAQGPFLINEYYAGGAADGWVKKQTLADGAIYQFSYSVDANGKITQTDVTYPRFTLPTRRVTLSGNGYILTDTRGLNTPDVQTRTYERQSGTNLVLSITDPLVLPSGRNRKTAFGYDALGNVTGITRTVGELGALITTFGYESVFSQLASITDPLLHTTTFDYDPNDPKVVLQSVTDPTGRRIKVTFNAAGQLTSVTQPFLVSDPNPVLRTTTFTFEGADLVTITDPEQHTTTRFVDAAGRVRGVKDALGRLTRYDYDTLNHLTTVTDPLSGITTFTYDADGNLKTVEDARQQAAGTHKVTNYTYDSMNRLKTRQDPLGRPAEVFDYDPAGNLKTYTDRRGKIADFQYDGLNRRSCAGFARASGAQPDCTMAGRYERAISYMYDPGNRLTSVTDSLAGATITRTFDNFDHLTFESTPPRGSVTYTYVADRRRSLAATGQSALCYDYDDADRLTAIREGGCAAAQTVTISPDSAGRRATLTLPGGVTQTYGYNGRSLVSSLQYAKADGSVLGGLTYDYDAAGNRTVAGGSWARTGLPPAPTSAGHDDANELTQWVTSSGTTYLNYDANGNLLVQGTTTYGFDARNQLKSITVSGSPTATFQYDGLGRRMQKTIGSTTTGFLYDGANPVQELDASGAPTANLLTGFGIDEFFRRTTGSGSSAATRVFLPDALGSTLALTDQNGALQNAYQYEPFGRMSLYGNQIANSNSYQFTGREDDAVCQGGTNPGASCTSNVQCGTGGTCVATGLYYYRARYYAPTWGRFISEDPIGFNGGDFNLYSYVGASPPNFGDPLGLFQRGKFNVYPFPPGGRGCRPYWLGPPPGPGQTGRVIPFPPPPEPFPWPEPIPLFWPPGADCFISPNCECNPDPQRCL